MSRTPSPIAPEHATAMRQLKILVVILLTSNIVLGIVGFALLRGLDRQYSTLIGRSVQVMNDLQTQTARTVEAMRSTNITIYAGVNDGRGALVQNARASLERDRQLRAALLAEEWLDEDSVERGEYRQAGEEFSRIASDVVSTLATGKLDEANQLREGRLRPAFERYMAATTKAAHVLLDESVRIKDELSAKTGRASSIVFGLGGWPVAIFCGLLGVTALFVLVLIVAFRGRQSTEAQYR